MLKEKILTIAILCLSISIVISSLFIAKEIRNNGQYVNSSLSIMSGGLNKISNSLGYMNNSVNGNSSYSSAEAAQYLGITRERLYEIANAKDFKMLYIKIGVDYYFSKNALDKWLETARVEIK